MPPRRRRRHPNWPYFFATLTLVLFPLVYSAVDVFWKYLERPRYFGGPGEVIGSIFEATVILWGFAVGACMGSFLNVVALRAPRGETIGGSSYCPYCHSSIRSRDNIPILGWLGLRGRCYACRLPISPRYMIIEIIAGVLMGVIVWVQVIHGGINLPLDGYIPGSPSRLVLRWDTLLLGRSLYHILVLLYLMTCALVVGNRLHLPGSMIASGWILTVVPPLCFPRLLMWSWKSVALSEFSGAAQYLQAAMTIMTGGVVGVLLARATLTALYPGADPKLSSSHTDTKSAWDWVWQLAWLGVAFGWQGVLGVGLMWCILLAIVYPWIRKWQFPLALPPTLLFSAAWLHLLLWRGLVQVPFWPGGAWLFWGALAGLIGAMVLAKLLIDSDWQNSLELPQDTSEPSKLTPSVILSTEETSDEQAIDDEEAAAN